MKKSVNGIDIDFYIECANQCKEIGESEKYFKIKKARKTIEEIESGNNEKKTLQEYMDLNYSLGYWLNWETHGISVLSDYGQYVYLIFNPINFLTKIGVTTNPKKRIMDLRSSSGIDLDYYLLFEGSEIGLELSIYSVEQLLHKYFKKKRKIGEWFDLTYQERHEIYNFLVNYSDSEEINNHTINNIVA